uniref:Uncharacterized protein n=1 Tax=Glycine max TaxID=3847 RepID=C6TFB6_SOYBN|nr:unknown [Glycine max]
MDVSLKAERRSGGIIATHYLSILINHELGKVPLNIITKNSPFPPTSRICTKEQSCPHSLMKDGEFRFEARADKIHNFIIAFWFLLTKLVTWKCQNLQAIDSAPYNWSWSSRCLNPKHIVNFLNIYNISCESSY